MPPLRAWRSPWSELRSKRICGSSHQNGGRPRRYSSLKGRVDREALAAKRRRDLREATVQ